MKSVQKIARSLLCLLCLLFAVLLIQNAPVVAKGAVQGIRLCLQTVIPSLFCFMAGGALSAQADAAGKGV